MQASGLRYLILPLFSFHVIRISGLGEEETDGIGWG